MPIDWLRCAEPDSGVALERPSDLIISSGPRAMRMPALAGSGEPLWLCVYDQDFLPLRERLRDLGVHYLVSGDLAPHAFELFLRQLLNRGEDRRQVRRIPLHCDVQLVTRRQRCAARMLELSRESCVFVTSGQLAAGERVTLRFLGERDGRRCARDRGQRDPREPGARRRAPDHRSRRLRSDRIRARAPISTSCSRGTCWAPR